MCEILNEDEVTKVLKKMGFSVYLSTFKEAVRREPLPLDTVVRAYLRFNNVPGSGGYIRDTDRIIYEAQYERIYKRAKEALDSCRTPINN